MDNLLLPSEQNLDDKDLIIALIKMEKHYGLLGKEVFYNNLTTQEIVIYLKKVDYYLTLDKSKWPALLLKFYNHEKTLVN